MKNFMRERKVPCGENYKAVLIYPYSEEQEQALKRCRGSRNKTTTPKQTQLNQRHAERYFIAKAHENFSAGDKKFEGTYDKAHLPKTAEEAERNLTNFIARLNYECKKQGFPPVAYMATLEGGDGQIRIHHHMILKCKLSRDEIENIWRIRKNPGAKKDEVIGDANCQPLRFDYYSTGIKKLCSYMLKKTKGRYRYRCSKGMKEPQLNNPKRKNDSRYSFRQIQKLALNPPDVSYWEKQYKGYTIADIENDISFRFNDETGKWSVYLFLKRIE